MKRVYTFGNGKAEGRADMKNLLGGKGANLAEMNLIGVPVPPGFTITTEVCTTYNQLGKDAVVAQLEDDVKKGNYNPFAKDYIIKGFDDRIKNMLLLMMAETCREFEKLPIIKYADILRNILYSGVWCRFESISRKRREEREKEDV